MSRDYQRQYRNQYHLPDDVFKQALWIIRGYNRLKDEANEVLYESPAAADGMPHSTNVGNPVEAKMLKRAADLERIKKIDEAKNFIPPEYMSGVWNSIMYETRYPDDANRHTYGVWKAAFVYKVAELFEII